MIYEDRWGFYNKTGTVWRILRGNLSASAMGRHHHRRGQNNKRGDVDSVDGSSTGEERPEPLAGHEKYEKVLGTFRHVLQNSCLRCNYRDTNVPHLECCIACEVRDSWATLALHLFAVMHCCTKGLLLCLSLIYSLMQIQMNSNFVAMHRA